MTTQDVSFDLDNLILPQDEQFFEKKISSLIENQFPAFYRENGPLLVAFVKAYYQWMEEQGQTMFHTRRLAEYHDVDLTIDDFVVFFKEKYLKNIRINTVTGTRTLVKHSLDIYRSKGSERCINLLFRAAYGVDVRVYYPTTDIMRLSDGEFVTPRYLEVAVSDVNASLEGKQIIGLNSKATAFVDSVVRRSIGDQGFVDVFYISAVEGNFEAGEKLDTTD
jgi:hypothetical protein